VLHELDGMAEERALVHAGDEALDHVPGAQIEPRDAGDGLGCRKRRGSSSFTATAASFRNDREFLLVHRVLETDSPP